MGKTKIDVTNYKTQEKYELYKVPTEALLKDAEIEIGQLKAYIDELEYTIKMRDDTISALNAKIGDIEGKVMLEEKVALKAYAKEVKREELYLCQRNIMRRQTKMIRELKSLNHELLLKCARNNSEVKNLMNTSPVI